jgi:hypothetical protein
MVLLAVAIAIALVIFYALRKFAIPIIMIVGLILLLGRFTYAPKSKEDTEPKTQRYRSEITDNLGSSHDNVELDPASLFASLQPIERQ